MIYRGSTPTHSFVLPFDLENIANIVITYRQNGCNVLSKTMEDNFDDFTVDMEARQISVQLTQNETQIFTCGPKYKNNIVQIQVKVLFESGSVLMSDVITDKIINGLADGSIRDSGNRLTETHVYYDGGGVAGY